MVEVILEILEISSSVRVEATFDMSPRILKELLAKLFVFFALYVNPRRLIITSENISLQIFNKSLRLNFRAIPAFSQTLRFFYSIWRPWINKFRSWNQGGFAGLAEFSVLPCVQISFPEHWFNRLLLTVKYRSGTNSCRLIDEEKETIYTRGG